jgi:TonB-like protein
MAYRVTIVPALCCWAFAQGQGVHPAPTEFEIGRQTFFDFGPPFDFYELLLVRPAANGTAIERITLTPAADACQSARIELATGVLRDSVAELLGKTNPCTIPEKELHREMNRCKKCLVFSGAHVAMQVQCASATRIIRSDILDRDMFDPAPKTPAHTSWTMQLLNRIDQALGPGVMDRPIFPMVEEEKTIAPTKDDETARSIGAGRYDDLFKGAPDKPSELYRMAQIRPPVPTIRLTSSTPFQPEVFVQPGYPPLARQARIDGIVNFTVDVNPDGSAANFTVLSGHPMLRGTTEKAVSSWKFPKGAAGQRIHAAVEFATNCPAKQK